MFYCMLRLITSLGILTLLDDLAMIAGHGVDGELIFLIVVPWWREDSSRFG